MSSEENQNVDNKAAETSIGLSSLPEKPEIVCLKLACQCGEPLTLHRITNGDSVKWVLGHYEVLACPNHRTGNGELETTRLSHGPNLESVVNLYMQENPAAVTVISKLQSQPATPPNSV